MTSWGREGEVFWRPWHEVMRLTSTIHPSFLPCCPVSNCRLFCDYYKFSSDSRAYLLAVLKWRLYFGREIVREPQPFSQKGSEASTLSGTELLPNLRQWLRNRGLKTVFLGDLWPAGGKKLGDSIPRRREESHDSTRLPKMVDSGQFLS